MSEAVNKGLCIMSVRDEMNRQIRDWQKKGFLDIRQADELLMISDDKKLAELLDKMIAAKPKIFRPIMNSTCPFTRVCAKKSYISLPLKAIMNLKSYATYYSRVFRKPPLNGA